MRRWLKHLPTTASRSRASQTAARDDQSRTLIHVREGGVIADGCDAELDEYAAIQNNFGEFLWSGSAVKHASGSATLKVDNTRAWFFILR